MDHTYEPPYAPNGVRLDATMNDSGLWMWDARFRIEVRMVSGVGLVGMTDETRIGSGGLYWQCNILYRSRKSTRIRRYEMDKPVNPHCRITYPGNKITYSSSAMSERTGGSPSGGGGHSPEAILGYR